MKLINGIAASAALIIFSNTSFASGAYISGSLGKSSANVDSVTGISIDENSNTFSFALGYKLNENIAIEGGYRDLGEINANATGSINGTYLGKPFVATGTVGVDVETTGFFLGGDFSLPVSDKVSAHVKAGIFKWDADLTGSGTGSITYDGTVYATGTALTGSEDGTDLYFGLGADYKLNDSVGLGVQWVRYKDILDTDIDVFEATVNYSF
ncbi:MAG: outer membrane beta-barrel protein [Candidatus Sedimenticola sp. PURPLELP]